MMERNASIDILKGIGILAVIMGHCMDLPHVMRNFIFSFHMPLFFIASGYFWHKQSLKHSCLGGIKLLKYYFVAAIVFAIASIYSSDMGGGKDALLAITYANAVPGDSITLGRIPPIKVLWFLPALFWCRLFFNEIEKRIIPFEKWQLFLFLCISYIACLSTQIVSVPFGIQAGASALVFYSSGVLISREVKMKRVCLALVGLWFISFFLPKYDMGAFTNSFYPIRIVGGIGGTIFFMKISSYISKIDCLTVILSFIGRFSLYFFILHALLNPIITIITGYHGFHLYTVNASVCFIVIFFSFSVYRYRILKIPK